jgi:hypothetical protein
MMMMMVPAHGRVLGRRRQLIQAACSMFGAWGKAISNTNGTLYQLRALDWSTDGPFQQVPTPHKLF